jgi:hypothetical protein
VAAAASSAQGQRSTRWSRGRQPPRISRSATAWARSRMCFGSPAMGLYGFSPETPSQSDNLAPDPVLGVGP